ncbi:uncharacterized protein LOC21412484 [Morus notabilis]|uniref:uncharacterized protein LOC21412484 n=1 Tax=Morus notabilis TaxID=981085 RepID=UPI000CED47EF|nr:uncharacterized protein LOC21412484 [Morus notabilis]
MSPAAPPPSSSFLQIRPLGSQISCKAAALFQVKVIVWFPSRVRFTVVGHLCSPCLRSPVGGFLHSFAASKIVRCFRFQETEGDCTETLNMDDRYIKAYSRRATARKELGKLKESIEG